MTSTTVPQKRTIRFRIDALKANPALHKAVCVTLDDISTRFPIVVTDEGIPTDASLSQQLNLKRELLDQAEQYPRATMFHANWLRESAIDEAGFRKLYLATVRPLWRQVDRGGDFDATHAVFEAEREHILTAFETHINHSRTRSIPCRS